jgi:putative hemolysin
MSTTQLLVTTSASAGSPHYTLLVAQQQADIRAAQRLRHRVFADEVGAVLHTPEPGLDIDDYDAHCDHLVVREDSTGEIVGTYRMLSPDGARRAGGLYCETEFLIPTLAGLRETLVETGRSCVHPHHRTGAVVNLVWAGTLTWRRRPSAPACPRCCAATCGWAPGCAGRLRTTRTSGWPTSWCC